MGLFSGIEDAKASQAANYLRPGTYMARVDKMEVIKCRDKKEAAVINLTCVACLQEIDGKSHKSAETFSDLYKEGDNYLRNVKAVLAGMSGFDDDQITDDFASTAFGPDQPFVGTVFLLEAYKPAEGKQYVPRKYVRRVPLSEVEEHLSEQTRKILWPGDTWDAAKEIEAGIYG